MRINIDENDLERSWFLVSKILLKNTDLFYTWKTIDPKFLHSLITQLESRKELSSNDLENLKQAKRLLVGGQITIYLPHKKPTQEQIERYANIFKEISDALKKNNIFPSNTLESDVKIDSYISLRRDQDENGNYVPANNEEKTKALKKLGLKDPFTEALQKRFSQEETQKNKHERSRSTTYHSKKKILEVENRHRLQNQIIALSQLKKSFSPRTPD
jgi:hypothetical protein